MIDFKNILVCLLLIPLSGILMLLFVPSSNHNLLKKISFRITCLAFVLSFYIWIIFNKTIGSFQLISNLNWLNSSNFILCLGIDGISLFFLLLTTFLVSLCLLVSWNSIKNNLKEYLIAFLIMEFFLVGVFCILDLFLFYIFFEMVLIPMFLIIGIWGSRERKIKAAYFFFIYTLLGSIFMLLSLIYIYFQVGTTDYRILLTFSFSYLEQYVLWLTFFFSFATKVPMLPVHLWLPEAHVEAPTSGSVILAGVLLKLGTYGLIRFSLPLFPQASFYFSPLVYVFAAIGIVYASFTAIRQTDFKRIIAYTSIAHMNLVVIGIFSFNTIGLEGAICQSLSHGFVASALFIVIGVVYDRHGTRTVKYYGGLVHLMPMYSFIFLFFTMANIGLPGTGSFVGEFLILTGSFKSNTCITFISASSMIIGGCYSLWLYNRIIYGNLKTQFLNNFLDLSKREFVIFLPLIAGTLVLGITPSIFLDFVHMSVNLLIELMYF